MLTVFAVCTGTKYAHHEVRLLKAQVEENLSLKHRFICFTDRPIDGVTSYILDKPYCSWWDKLRLFKEDLGPSLYFDLDVVITGSLDYLAEYTKHTLAAPANWGQSGHGGIQSSVMAWDGWSCLAWDKFDYEVDAKRLHGDQCFLTEHYGDTYVKIPGIFSYKYHCQGGLPKGCSVVCFHGDPKPNKVNHDWVKNARRYPR